MMYFVLYVLGVFSGLAGAFFLGALQYNRYRNDTVDAYQHGVIAERKRWENKKSFSRILEMKSTGHDPSISPKWKD